MHSRQKAELMLVPLFPFALIGMRKFQAHALTQTISAIKAMSKILTYDENPVDRFFINNDRPALNQVSCKNCGGVRQNINIARVKPAGRCSAEYLDQNEAGHCSKTFLRELASRCYVEADGIAAVRNVFTFNSPRNKTDDLFVIGGYFQSTRRPMARAGTSILPPFTASRLFRT